MKQLLLIFFILTSLTAITTKVYAVRPFITDDAAVAEHRHIQLETWTLFEQDAGEHWIMWSYGLYDNLEISLGSLWGYIQSESGHTELTFAMPLLEAKYLFREYQPFKFPGIALAAGTFLPYGRGEFVAPSFGVYSVLAFTQCFGQNEDVLIHANIGVNYLREYNELDKNNKKKNQFLPIWGIGTQIRAYRGLHFVGEIVAGDPYVPGTGFAVHTGFRYFINDYVQLDASIGQGIAGDNKVPFWAGFGARFVITWFEE